MEAGNLKNRRGETARRTRKEGRLVEESQSGYKTKTYAVRIKLPSTPQLLDLAFIWSHQIHRELRLGGNPLLLEQ